MLVGLSPDEIFPTTFSSFSARWRYEQNESSTCHLFFLVSTIIHNEISNSISPNGLIISNLLYSRTLTNPTNNKEEEEKRWEYYLSMFHLILLSSKYLFFDIRHAIESMFALFSQQAACSPLSFSSFCFFLLFPFLYFVLLIFCYASLNQILISKRMQFAH